VDHVPLWKEARGSPLERFSWTRSLPSPPRTLGEGGRTGVELQGRVLDPNFPHENSADESYLRWKMNSSQERNAGTSDVGAYLGKVCLHHGHETTHVSERIV